MSKFRGSDQSGAGPIGGVLPMDPASGDFEHRQAAKSRVTAGPRVGARHDGIVVFLKKLSDYKPRRASPRVLPLRRRLRIKKPPAGVI